MYNTFQIHVHIAILHTVLFMEEGLEVTLSHSRSGDGIHQGFDDHVEVPTHIKFFVVVSWFGKRLLQEAKLEYVSSVV